MAKPFYKSKPLRRTWLNRLFASIYASAIVALLHHHLTSILSSTTSTPLSQLLLFTSDLILAFMWCTTQSFRLFPVRRTELITEMNKTMHHDGRSAAYPKLDVFICTADPYKEPPMSVVNTALSVMAYDYPTENVCVYVSDDGGSQMTLFAFMEAAKFAREWIPFCKKNELLHRSPEAYFGCLDLHCCPGTEDMKILYESMKVKVENVLLKGRVETDDLKDETNDSTCTLDKWRDEGFMRSDHPTVVHKLLEADKDRDVNGRSLPSLVYVTREKRRNVPHNFKAGALNVLLRVSAVMTNAPIILTLDCDMYSNDPITPQRALCYFLSEDIKSNLGYIQFPQRYHGINKNDNYASQHMHLFRLNPLGMDGLLGPNYVGTGCFFLRRAFFGSPGLPPLDPSCDDQARSVLDAAHHVASCGYEKGSMWGSKIGFRYGSLVEDYYTGYRLQCEGWRSVFCDPSRAAFLGDVPITFDEVLNQNKRWALGTLEVALSKYTPLNFGIRKIGLLMSLSYLYYGFWALLSIPIVVYSVLPQLALLNKVPIFPKVTETWFLLYCFLFAGAYGQDLAEFVLEGSTARQWWSDQRCWIINGTTCYPFALVEFTMKSLGMSVGGFNLTNKVIDEEQSKRYERGVFEFGVHSAMFVSMTVVALLNLAAFVYGLVKMLSGEWAEETSSLAVQQLIAGYWVLNHWCVYEGITLRADSGRMPFKTTLAALIISFGLYLVSIFV
ncbi:unnamed protein product [Rhodiola kirilowii]